MTNLSWRLRAVRAAGLVVLAMAIRAEAAAPAFTLPSDLNSASLCVHAIDTIYELDLSPEQLKAIKTAAAGCASQQTRTSAPENAKLASTMADLARALLAHGDDDEIAKLRNDFAEQSTDESAKLDDDIDATPAARAKAAEVSPKLNAGQLAAFLASHADEVVDPAESMVATLTELHDAETPAAGDQQIKDTSEELGYLIAGQDPARSAAAAARVSTWLKANRETPAAQIATNKADLTASAKKAVGEVKSIEVLSHWIDNATAELLSNPQLPKAIDAVLAAEPQDTN